MESIGLYNIKSLFMSRTIEKRHRKISSFLKTLRDMLNVSLCLNEELAPLIYQLGERGELVQDKESFEIF
jgi:hypothetical protein